MTHRNALLREPALHLRRQLQQPHAIGHGRATLADFLRDVFLAQAKFLGEAGEGVRFFDRVEVFALEILDERELEDILVGSFADDDRRFHEPNLLRSTPAAFTGDELVGIPALPGNERLDDAVLLDGSDELLEMFVAENGTRLERRRYDLGQ